MQSDPGKLPFSSSPGDILTDVHTVEQPAVSTSCLQGDEVPESNLNTVCSVGERSTCASLYGQVPVTPTKGIDPIENYGSLDLSNNNLSGTFPPEICFRLGENLDLSNNNLTQEIQKAPDDTFVGNSGLCGDARGLTRACNSTKNNDKVIIGVLVPVCGLLVVATTIGITMFSMLV